ncbi:TRAP transporter small permease [Clostridium vitabionis]|uniref:TRAP transporter small permease n=1 Tax=Clostridium vitabionis TaxID=2784388 RepID=UPI00188B9395|nr:TRAP transporter small permease [Clostridium vitabionis]
MDSFKRIWGAIDRVVFAVVKYACAAMLGLLICIVFYIFLGRYVFHNSPMWGEPLSLFLLTWMSILGSALVLRKNEHLRVTMFDDKMSAAGITATEILTVACVLVFALFMIIHGQQLMVQARKNTMAGVNIPYAWMYLSLPVTGVMYLFALAGQLLDKLEEKK